MPGTSGGTGGRESGWSEVGQVSGVRTRLWWRGEEGETVERLWGVWRSHFVVRREWEGVQDCTASAETCRGIIIHHANQQLVRWPRCRELHIHQHNYSN